MSENVYARPYPTNNIYDNLRVTQPGPRTQQNAVKRTTAQHGGSHRPKNNRSKAAAGCLGTVCLLLLAAIIGLVIHNNIQVKHLERLELQTRHNLTEEKAMLQTSLDELHARYINLTQERDDLKKRLSELPGWKKFGSSYYYISCNNSAKTWDDSRRYCRERKSDLMVINGKDKQDFVISLGQRVWLGLTDTEREGHFKWVNGAPLTTPTYWVPGEPNNKGEYPKKEDCVEFLNGPNHKGWNDRSCTELNHWICEKVIY